MKKIIAMLLVVVCLIGLSGCNLFSNEPIEFEGDTVVFQLELEDPTLYLSTDIPRVILHIKDEYCLFYYDSLDSGTGPGTFTMENNILTLVDTDAKHSPSVYVFRIIDKQTIKFLASESSEIIVHNEDLVVPFEDGAIFKAVDGTFPGQNAESVQ